MKKYKILIPIRYNEWTQILHVTVELLFGTKVNWSLESFSSVNKSTSDQNEVFSYQTIA